MDSHQVALVVAGAIGSGVALIHGVLTQRLMVQPFYQLADGGFTRSARRLIPVLLHFSTFNWFIGGIALIVAAIFFQWQARAATGALIGSSYLFGALGNLWGARRPHPGWMLYAIALGLIVYGLCASDW